MLWKPMLASAIDTTAENWAAGLKFPLLASPKLDGIRATKQDGQLYSRSLKLIPNSNLQSLMAHVPNGIDGELILGEPNTSTVFRDTISVVMSDDKMPTGVALHVFDHFGPAGAQDRLTVAESALTAAQQKYGRLPVRMVRQVLVHNVNELLAFEEQVLNDGYEGVMLKAPDGRYKQGRSTVKEGILLKLKRFADAEAVIIGCEELMHNGNEAVTNELGRTSRSSHQANKTGRNTLGKFVVKGIGDDFDGVEFEVGTGFDDAERTKFWKSQATLIGKIIKFKHFPVGHYDLPRHPVFLGFRDRRDMS